LFDLENLVAGTQRSLVNSFPLNWEKQVRGIFSPCIEILHHKGLQRFSLEKSNALSALVSTEMSLLNMLRPMLSACYNLQIALGETNQRMLPGMEPDIQTTLENIASKCSIQNPSSKSGEILEKAHAKKPSEGVFVKAPKRSATARRNRPFASGEPKNSSYKKTDIGFLAILEYADESYFENCDDSEL